MAVSQAEDRILWAFPGEGELGDIVVYDIQTEEIKSIFAGYTDQSYELTWIDMNPEGTMVAAATTEGKTIHVFDAKNGSVLYTLSRGSIATHIWFIAFQLKSTKLTVSSSNGTIHIFKLLNGEENNQENNTRMGYLKSYMSFFSGQGSYAKFRISDQNSISVMPTENSIQAISTEGKIYFGQIDTEQGEDVILEDTFDIAIYKVNGKLADG